MSFVAVILAAGGGSRWTGDGHKLLALIDGTSVIELAMNHAAQAFPEELIVVDGAVDLSAVAPTGTTVLHNGRWANGQGTSLAVAIEHVRPRGHEFFVVGLGDQPFIEPSAWAAVAETDSPVAVATYGGHRGQPVRLGREVWDLLDLSGDEGARSLLRNRPDLVREVPCSGNSADIDTVGDITRWTS